MKKFVRLYTRMTNCCFIFSLQAGVVIIGVLGIVWTVTSLMINLFVPHESETTASTVLQYTVAYLVLVVICLGHLWILLAGSAGNPNLMFLGFLFNTIIMMTWLVLTVGSYYNSPSLRAVICIEGRCPDVLWLFDAYWRDTGIKCQSGVGDQNPLLATREVFSIAPVLGYIGHWPDYIEQPGPGAPCYENIPDTEHYVAYDVAANVSCPRADWLTWDPHVVAMRKEMAKGLRAYEEEKKSRGPLQTRRKRNVSSLDGFNSTNLNDTAKFNQFLQQGCQRNEPRFIVASMALTLFFAYFFLFGRAIEFNYYHELIMPFALERARFKPPTSIRVV